MSSPCDIPDGAAHFALISKINSSNRLESEKLLQDHADLNRLGTALSALYLAATCERNCWGDDHILEGLAARVYRLSCASYALICVGQYDESVGLIRSIGEVGKILCLTESDRERFGDQPGTGREGKKSRFGPNHVDQLLKRSEIALADDQWLSKIGESYAHSTSKSGGIVQPGELHGALERLTRVVEVIALFYCGYFELHDYFDRISEENRQEVLLGQVS